MPFLSYQDLKQIYFLLHLDYMDYMKSTNTRLEEEDGSSSFNLMLKCFTQFLMPHLHKHFAKADTKPTRKFRTRSLGLEFGNCPFCWLFRRFSVEIALFSSWTEVKTSLKSEPKSFHKILLSLLASVNSIMICIVMYT